MMRSGRKIQLARTGLNISQSALAAELETSQGVVGMWESGSQLPGQKTVRNLAKRIIKILRLDAEALMAAMRYERYIYNIQRPGLFATEIAQCIDAALVQYAKKKYGATIKDKNIMYFLGHISAVDLVREMPAPTTGAKVVSSKLANGITMAQRIDLVMYFFSDITFSVSSGSPSGSPLLALKPWHTNDNPVVVFWD